MHIGPREITKEEYTSALKDGAGVLIPNDIKIGYGVYSSRVFEKQIDDKTHYYLEYDMGDSCD